MLLLSGLLTLGYWTRDFVTRGVITAERQCFRRIVPWHGKLGILWGNFSSVSKIFNYRSGTHQERESYQVKVGQGTVITASLSKLNCYTKFRKYCLSLYLGITKSYVGGSITWCRRMMSRGSGKAPVHLVSEVSQCKCRSTYTLQCR